MFLGHPDPHTNPLVRGTNPRIRIRNPYQNVTDPQHCLLGKFIKAVIAYEPSIQRKLAPFSHIQKLHAHHISFRPPASIG
jgi:hypothetical protein